MNAWVCFMIKTNHGDEKWVKENGGYEYTPPSMNHLMEVNRLQTRSQFSQ